MSTPVVLISGALTGIGRATAFAFAKEGARVVVSGRRDDAGEALAVELRATGAEAQFIRADVRHENDVRNLVDNTVARFGRLDVAVDRDAAALRLTYNRELWVNRSAGRAAREDSYGPAWYLQAIASRGRGRAA
jgi:NAD(P)-dependent dehydrogenase (short-subunit alcohol dehydrogenase family)